MARATLVEISADQKPKELGQPSPAQFNPTSLRLALANTANSDSRPRRQATGTSTSKLTLSLIYDTAEEADAGGKAVSALARAAQVTQFLQASKRKGTKKQAPG